MRLSIFFHRFHASSSLDLCTLDGLDVSDPEGVADASQVVDAVCDDGIGVADGIT